MKTIEKNKRIHLQLNKTHNCYESYSRKLPFNPPKLPYSYSALNKISDTENLKNHFLNYHMKGFEDFLEYINGTEAENMGICHIFKKEQNFDKELIESACIVFNHQFFWDNLCPYCGEVSNDLEHAINNKFGNINNLKQIFIDLGLKMKSNGWLWLIVNKNNEIHAISTLNNNNTLQESAIIKGSPILAIDLWEHAYKNKFNKKEDYINAVFGLINWSQVSSRYRFSI